MAFLMNCVVLFFFLKPPPSISWSLLLVWLVRHLQTFSLGGRCNEQAPAALSVLMEPDFMAHKHLRAASPVRMPANVFCSSCSHLMLLLWGLLTPKQHEVPLFSLKHGNIKQDKDRPYNNLNFTVIRQINISTEYYCIVDI